MLSLIVEYRNLAQGILGLLICLSALRWGGGPERILALVWLIIFEALDYIYHAIWDLPFRLNQLDLFHASLDLTATIICVLVALNANRMYTLWFASFQLISLFAHLAREMAEAVTPITYAVLVIAPSYFQLAILSGGLILHVRRTRNFGKYRDWRSDEFGKILLARMKGSAS